ncbi:MAG TPA: hypothetical protein VG426_11275 [Candidatus Dormibacteraeota bacterium]|nr:hypothetical protein [Candidatus Dormibacteraeota bacterium]
MIPLDERAAGLLRSPLGLTLLQMLAIQPRPQDIRDMSEAELYGSAVSTCIFMSPHRSDYDSRRTELLAMAPRFAELAERVVRLPATATWWDPMDADHQVWVSKTGERPSADRMEIKFAQYLPEVTKPRQAIWTSSPVRGGLPAGWIEWLVSGEDQRPGPYSVWRMLVGKEARIFEIHSPGDWHRLATTYAGVSSGREKNPDWMLVSRDWDAVHLSVGGLLTAQAVAVESEAGTTTLRGWDVESTVWLRWAFTGAERLPDIL